MKIVFFIILILCLCAVLFASVIFVNDYLDGDNEQSTEILMSAFCVGSIHGMLALLLFPFIKKFRYIPSLIFLGYFAGIMGTNFVSNILSKEGLDDIITYFFIFLFYIIAIAGCVLAIHLNQKETIQARQS